MGRMKEYVATYRMIGLYGIRIYIYTYVREYGHTCGS